MLVTLLDPVTCLAAAIYFEARGESAAQQLMVAETIMNRVESPRFPNTVCGVVKQKRQFSFYWDGLAERVDDKMAWAYAVLWANDALKKQHLGYHKACHYARKDIIPKWSAGMKAYPSGNHVFYEGGC